MGNPHEIKFILKKPSTSYIKNIFFIAFSWKVWVSIIVILIIFSIANSLVLNWEKNNEQFINQRIFTISDATLVALEAVCQQGTTTEPSSFSGRIVSYILFSAFMFIYVSYSANIVVLLQSTTPINNLDELLESRIEVSALNVSYMQHYLQVPKAGILKDLYLQKIAQNPLCDTDKGMKKVREGNFAFQIVSQIGYQYILKNFTNYEICGLQQLPGYFEYQKAYIALPKRSPYKDLFKVGFLKVDEYGIQRRTSSRIIMKPRCYFQSTSFKTIDIYDCYHLFLIWILGCISSILILYVERLINLCKIHSSKI